MITVYSAFSNACEKYLDVNALRVELTTAFCNKCYASTPIFVGEDILNATFLIDKTLSKVTQKKGPLCIF
jgi:hypothetical protein